MNRITTIAAGLSLAFVGTSTPVAHGETETANDLYVSTTGSDQNPGTSAAPLATIQKAISLATSSTQNIFIQPGEYKTVAAGGKETFPITTHPFEGSIVGLGNWQDPASSFVTIDAGNTDTIFKVESYYGATFENLVLKNGGLAYDSSLPARYGGAFFINSSTPRIRNCKMTQGSGWYGGAVYIMDSGGPTTNAVEFSNCVFHQNAVQFSGGAIGGQSAEIVISNSNFTQNSVVDGDGGAISLVFSDIDVKDSMFKGNQASEEGGACNLNNMGLPGPGHSVGIVDADFSHCQFDNNSSTSTGSGGGGALHIMGYFDSTIDFCEFSNNEVNSNSNDAGGGAIYIAGNVTNEGGPYPATVQMNQCVLTNNHSNNGPGGGMAIRAGSDVVIKGSETQIEYNTSNEHTGGGIDLWGVASNPASLIVLGGTFKNNDSRLSQGGGIFVGRNANATVSNVRMLYNGTLNQGDISGAIYCLGWEYADSYCCLGHSFLCGNASDQSTASCQVYGVNYQPPGPPHTDPCGLSGNQTCDHNVQQPTGCGSEDEYLPGDFNQDGSVDVLDLTLLRSNLSICPHDIDHDGDTDVEDLLLFLAGYGTTCP